MKKKRFIAIRNQADSTLELYFLDVIEDSFDWYMGWASKVQEVIDKVNYYKPSKIKVIIDSEGGDAQTGMSIYNFLKRCEAKVEVEIIGLAASIAAIIAMAANKGKLRIAKNAFIMIHKAEGACWGTGDELRKGADLVDMYTGQIVDILSQRSGKTTDEINAMIADGDFWMTGEEAVASGFADETFNDTPNLQIAARLDMSQYKNVPAQIRAQLKPADQDDNKNFIQNQFDQMKKFFTDIVNAMRGTKPAADANPQAIVTNLADAIQKPMETLGDEIDKSIDEKVNKATGEELITKVTNRVKEAIPPTVVDFTAEGPKNALDAAIKAALATENKAVNDRLTALETANTNLKTENDNLKKDITALKGGRSNPENNGSGKQSVGRFN